MQRKPSHATLFAIAATLFLMTLACGSSNVSSLRTPSPTPAQACIVEAQDYLLSLTSLLSEWDDAEQVAKATAMIALSGPVQELQAIRRRTQALSPTQCTRMLHSYIIADQNAVIDTFLTFMKGEPDSVVEEKAKIAREMRDRATQEMTRLMGKTVVTTVEPLALPEPTAIEEVASFDCADVSEIPPTECQALIALYNSTDGADWKDNTGWLNTDAPCMWQGVTCEDGRVIGLNLHNNRLTNTIPPELGNLANLQRLYLNDNRLSEALPQSLTNLTHLTTFWFTNTNLCAPEDEAFQSWVAGIGDVQPMGLTCSEPKSLGYRTAPVVVSIYCDFWSPHCATFANEVGVQIIEDYVKQGKVRYIFHHRWTGELVSLQAHIAAECAAEQYRFWEYYDILFANQPSFYKNQYKDLAEQIEELDQDRFAQCVDSEKYRRIVEEESNQATMAGITSVPTVLINGQVMILGAHAYSAFQTAIEEALRSL